MGKVKERWLGTRRRRRRRGEERGACNCGSHCDIIKQEEEAATDRNFVNFGPAQQLDALRICREIDGKGTRRTGKVVRLLEDLRDSSALTLFWLEKIFKWHLTEVELRSSP